MSFKRLLSSVFLADIATNVYRYSLLFSLGDVGCRAMLILLITLELR